MCFDFLPCAWLEDFGAAISEPFVVSESGGERLCDARRELMADLRNKYGYEVQARLDDQG